MKIKKRYIAGVLAAATLGGGAFAYANSLSVASQTLASGSAAVQSCQTTTVTVSYATTFTQSLNSGKGGYEVSGVTLNGLNTSCNGLAVTVDLSNGTASVGTASSASVTGGNGTSTGSMTLTPSPTPDASVVTSVAAVITG